MDQGGGSMSTAFSTSNNIENIAGALAKAQAKISHADAATTGQAKGGKYKYAKLENVITEVKPHLTEQGISFVQLPCREGNDCGVTTMLMHESGEFIKCTFMMPGNANLTPQGFGSLLTYARRYSLAALCGIGQEDDDAKKAQDETKKEQNVDQIVAARLEQVTAEAELAGKNASMKFYADYNKLVVKYAENIQMMNESAEQSDLDGLAIARCGIDDDDFASLNKLKQNAGGVFTDKCKKTMSTQGFADKLVNVSATEDAA
jgi:hypothetical protein